MKRLPSSAVLCNWGCVYPGCGAWFESYVELQAHVASHY